MNDMLVRFGLGTLALAPTSPQTLVEPCPFVVPVCRTEGTREDRGVDGSCTLGSLTASENLDVVVPQMGEELRARLVRVRARLALQAVQTANANPVAHMTTIFADCAVACESDEPEADAEADDFLG